MVGDPLFFRSVLRSHFIILIPVEDGFWHQRAREHIYISLCLYIYHPTDRVQISL
jgi:hypothetical protein